MRKVENKSRNPRKLIESRTGEDAARKNDVVIVHRIWETNLKKVFLTRAHIPHEAIERMALMVSAVGIHPTVTTKSSEAKSSSHRSAKAIWSQKIIVISLNPGRACAAKKITTDRKSDFKRYISMKLKDTILKRNIKVPAHWYDVFDVHLRGSKH